MQQPNGEAAAQRLDEVSFRLMVGSYIAALLLGTIGLVGLAFSLAAYGSIGRLCGISFARSLRRYGSRRDGDS